MGKQMENQMENQMEKDKETGKTKWKLCTQGSKVAAQSNLLGGSWATYQIEIAQTLNPNP